MIWEAMVPMLRLCHVYIITIKIAVYMSLIKLLNKNWFVNDQLFSSWLQ